MLCGSCSTVCALENEGLGEVPELIMHRGWDQTGSNGANLNWPQAFGLNTKDSSNDVWILGLVNAAPYFAASLL